MVESWDITTPVLLWSTVPGENEPSANACTAVVVRAMGDYEGGGIMHRKKSNPVQVIAVLLMVIFALLFAGAARSVHADDAKQILEATGVKGGLIIHIGCGDGTLTAALRANDSYLVQGLDSDAANVAQARECIQSQGVYGKVSVDKLTGDRLPYIDNLANLIVAEKLGTIPMDEVVRVLCPAGVAYVKEGDAWKKIVKPRPSEIDEWTHYLHDASGNPVAKDTVVGPPRRMQWVGSPRWARHHDFMASMSALVSTGGRIFYIFDEGPTESIQEPPQWVLLARDAFNGTVLWKRSISSWNTHLWPLKSGPAQLPRRLVAVGDTVFATLGLDAPLSALDAATGETIRTYEGTQVTEEVIASDAILFLIVKDSPVKWSEYRLKNTYVWDNTGYANKDWAWDEANRSVMAIQADTGNVLWKQQYPVAPLTLAANRAGVFFHDGESVVCLNRATGETMWRSEAVARRSPTPVSFGPRVIVYDDVVVFAGGTRSMTAFSAENGKTLWTAKHPPSGHMSLEDLFVVDGLVWSGATGTGRDSGTFTGLDLHTGEVKSEFSPDVETFWFHHRCYSGKATVRYLLPSRTGIEFLDLKSKHWEAHHWVRGGCIYGIMPCNGLVYAPPHSCACYLEAKLYGFCALAPESTNVPEPASVSDDQRLERGPAYTEGKAARLKPTSSDAWTMYRHDPARSGFTKTPVSASLTRLWQNNLGGKLSSVVVADGKLFVASVDTHTVHALDAGSGKTLWSHTTGGRVDSPPTIYDGRVLFGSADGSVYCLNASDGKLVWRFRAAPADRRLLAFEQVESVWPVHGSVLVQGGVAYCVAGRSMFLDGGLRLLRLDPKTGRKLSETLLDDRDPDTGENLQKYVKGLDMPPALPDLLSSDGRYIYMKSQQFNREGKRCEIVTRKVTDQEGEGAHLFAPAGLLDDTWFHRGYWIFGKATAAGWGGWPQAAWLVPAGRIAVFDDRAVYGFGRKPEYLCQSPVLEYQLFAADKEIKTDSFPLVTESLGKINKASKKAGATLCDWSVRKGYPVADISAVSYKWARDKLPFLVRAMVLADKTLFIAGPPDVVDEEEAFYHPDDPQIKAKLAEQSAAFRGSEGAFLWAVSASDGKTVAEYDHLESAPVFDGMVSCQGRLYIALQNGRIICMGS